MGVYRKTKSVEALLNEFEQKNKAISIAALLERFQESMNKSTVYRILKRLENNGILHSFIGKDGMKWYAKYNGCSASLDGDNHPHFQCRDCGKTACLSLEVMIPSFPYGKIESTNLLFIGQCVDCLV